MAWKWIDDVDEERERQRARGYTEAHDDAQEPATLLDEIHHQRTVAGTEWAGTEDLAALRARFVKIAALAVAALESIDRRDRRKGMERA